MPGCLHTLSQASEASILQKCHSTASCKNGASLRLRLQSGSHGDRLRRRLLHTPKRPHLRSPGRHGRGQTSRLCMTAGQQLQKPEQYASAWRLGRCHQAARLCVCGPSYTACQASEPMLQLQPWPTPHRRSIDEAESNSTPSTPLCSNQGRGAAAALLTSTVSPTFRSSSRLVRSNKLRTGRPSMATITSPAPECRRILGRMMECWSFLLRVLPYTGRSYNLSTLAARRKHCCSRCAPVYHA